MFHTSTCADLLQRIRRKVLFIWVSGTPGGTILLLRLEQKNNGELNFLLRFNYWIYLLRAGSCYLSSYSHVADCHYFREILPWDWLIPSFVTTPWECDLFSVWCSVLRRNYFQHVWINSETSFYFLRVGDRHGHFAKRTLLIYFRYTEFRLLDCASYIFNLAVDVIDNIIL